MLSQALQNETVMPQTYMPPRVKSAYVKLVGDSFNDLDRYRAQSPLNPDELRPSPKQHLSRRFSSSVRNFDDYKNEFYAPSSSNSPRREDRQKQQHIPSAHELVTAKNTAERLQELERTNLNLKRMLQYVANDPSRGVDRISSAAPRLLVHRDKASNPLGPPALRHGRIGSSWRHIKQTNNYTNSNLLFIDGTVRINDSARYPPSVYGYPPKVVNQSEDLIGLNTQSLNNLDLPLSQRIRSRPLNLGAYNNQFHDRAKQGFEYWNKDKREPDNNKPKAATISIGHPYFKSGF